MLMSAPLKSIRCVTDRTRRKRLHDIEIFDIHVRANAKPSHGTVVDCLEAGTQENRNDDTEARGNGMGGVACGIEHARGNDALAVERVKRIASATQLPVCVTL